MAVAGTLPSGLNRQPDFLRLWAGQTISAFGTQVTILAIPIVAALTLAVSPFEFGVLGALEIVPVVLLSLPAGVWVDRLRRRPILIGADLGRAAALLSIPVAAAFDVLTIWQLYAVVVLSGALSILFEVAWQSHLPSLVGRSELVAANARLELTRTISQRLGPGLAGAVVALVTAPAAVIVDALSFVASALFVGSIRRPEPAVIAAKPDAGAPRSSMRADIAIGFRFVGGERVLRALALSIAAGYLFGTVADAILILYLVTERGFTAAEIGIAFTLGSIGVILGAFLAPRLTRRFGAGSVILVAGVGEAVSWLPVGLAPDAFLFTGLATTIAALSLFGALWNANAISLRQALTPERLRGRVTATMRFISWCTIPVGTLLGGWLGGVIGLHPTIMVGAVGSLVTFVPILLSPIPSIRVVPEPVADPDVEPLVAAEPWGV